MRDEPHAARHGSLWRAERGGRKTVYALGLIFLLIVGAGRWSLDSVFGGHSREPRRQGNKP